MNYGMYLSASGVLTNLARQDVFANNLANVNTTAFKQDLATVRQRDPEVIEKSLGFDLKHDLLDRLGGGALLGEQRINFKTGPIQATGQQHDVALIEEGTFFAVEVNNAKTGQTEVQLTRDGRFARNSDGYLVLATGGQKVLDEADAPIRLAANAEFSIQDDGRIYQNGEPVARLQVTGVSDLDNLVKRGGNLFGFENVEDQRVQLDTAELRSGYLEGSGVDPIKELMQLVSATKAVSSNGNMIRYHDQLMDRAVNVLGRVA